MQCTFYSSGFSAPARVKRGLSVTAGTLRVFLCCVRVCVYACVNRFSSLADSETPSDERPASEYLRAASAAASDVGEWGVRSLAHPHETAPPPPL